MSFFTLNSITDEVIKFMAILLIFIFALCEYVALKMPKVPLKDSVRASIFTCQKLNPFKTFGLHFINSGVYFPK